MNKKKVRKENESQKQDNKKKPQTDKVKERGGRVRHTNPYLKRRRLLELTHSRANTVEMMDYVNKKEAQKL